MRATAVRGPTDARRTFEVVLDTADSRRGALVANAAAAEAVAAELDGSSRRAKKAAAEGATDGNESDSNSAVGIEDDRGLGKVRGGGSINRSGKKQQRRIATARRKACRPFVPSHRSGGG